MNRKHIFTTAIGVAALTAGIIGGTGAGFGIGRTTAPIPDACLVALDEADHALDLSSDALNVALEAVTVSASGDVESMDRINSDLDTVLSDLGEPTDYADASAECRGDAR